MGLFGRKSRASADESPPPSPDVTGPTPEELAAANKAAAEEKERNDAAAKIAAMNRGKKDRAELEEKKKAASTIAAARKGKADRKKAEAMKGKAGEPDNPFMTKIVEPIAQCFLGCMRCTCLEPIIDKQGLAELRVVFDQLDVDKSGSVDLKEWNAGVKQHRSVLSQYFGGSTISEIGANFRVMDKNRDGSLTWIEFERSAIKAVAKRRVVALKELKKLFDALDKDASGTVDSKEWGAAVAKNQEALAKHFGKVSLAQIGQVFKEIDDNGDNRLTWWEFEAAAAKKMAQTYESQEHDLASVRAACAAMPRKRGGRRITALHAPCTRRGRTAVKHVVVSSRGVWLNRCQPRVTRLLTRPRTPHPPPQTPTPAEPRHGLHHRGRLARPGRHAGRGRPNVGVVGGLEVASHVFPDRRADRSHLNLWHRTRVCVVRTVRAVSIWNGRE